MNITRRELVKSAIGHRTTHRVPYFIQLCRDAWDVLVESGVTGGRPEEEFVDSDVQVIKVPWWNWHELGPEWAGEQFPKTTPKCIGRDSYVDLADNVKQLRDECDRYFLVTIWGSHFEKAYFARGIENFLADMAGEPDEAAKFLRLIIDKNMVMLENFLSIPEIDGVLLGSDWGSQVDLLMSLNCWQEMIRPGEQREYDLIHSYGKDVWVHSCGNVTRIIPSLVEMGLDVLHPIQPEAMDISYLKREFGEKLAFWGGISTQQTLPFGTPDELREEARSVRALMSEGGGYIFSPAQSIQSDVPVENILALLEVAREE